MAAAAADGGSKATSFDVQRRSDSSHSVVLRRKSPITINRRHCAAICAYQRSRHLVRITTATTTTTRNLYSMIGGVKHESERCDSAEPS